MMCEAEEGLHRSPPPPRRTGRQTARGFRHGSSAEANHGKRKKRKKESKGERERRGESERKRKAPRPFFMPSSSHFTQPLYKQSQQIPPYGTQHMPERTELQQRTNSTSRRQKPPRTPEIPRIKSPKDNSIFPAQRQGGLALFGKMLSGRKGRAQCAAP